LRADLPLATAAASLPIRVATLEDAAALQRLIELSVRTLQKGDYSQEQIESALKTAFTLDTRLIADSTYFAIEDPTDGFVACGGWSRRRTLCGGDAHSVRDDSFLDPSIDAAKIRAFFVHPGWSRLGLGSRLLAHCEEAARAAGFHRCEMGATLTGVPLYQARGYRIVVHTSVPLCGASTLPVVIMERSISGIPMELLSRFSVARGEAE